MRLAKVCALVAGLAVTLAAATCPAGDAYYGMGLFGGTQWHGDPVWYISDTYDWQEVSVRPLLGLRKTKRWDLWFEGNLTYMALEDDPDSVELGALGMTSYDLLHRDAWGLFAEIGVGLGWMSDSPDDHIVGPGVLGFFDYGLGVRFRTDSGLLVRLGPRFHHCSSLFRDDAGLNTYGLMFSVAK